MPHNKILFFMLSCLLVANVPWTKIRFSGQTTRASRRVYPHKLGVYQEKLRVYHGKLGVLTCQNANLTRQNGNLTCRNPNLTCQNGANFGKKANPHHANGGEACCFSPHSSSCRKAVTSACKQTYPNWCKPATRAARPNAPHN